MVLAAIFFVLLAFIAKPNAIFVTGFLSVAQLSLGIDLLLRGKVWLAVLLIFCALVQTVVGVISSILYSDRKHTAGLFDFSMRNGFIHMRESIFSRKTTGRSEFLIFLIALVLFGGAFPFLQSGFKSTHAAFRPMVFIIALLSVLSAGVLLRRRSPWRSF